MIFNAWGSSPTPDRAMVPQPDRMDTRPWPTGLHRLIYTSEAWSPGEPEDGPHTSPREVAIQSGSRNAAQGLSGVLVFVQGHFIQILEGEVVVLEAVFERICRDMRHRALTLVDFSPATERLFEGWDMVPLDARLMDNPEPYEDLFMSIRGGMAPATIVRVVQGFLHELRPDRQDAS